MRGTLERFITEKRVSANDAKALRRAFDAHAGLVEVPRIDRKQVVKPPAPWWFPSGWIHWQDPDSP